MSRVEYKCNNRKKRSSASSAGEELRKVYYWSNEKKVITLLLLAIFLPLVVVARRDEGATRRSQVEDDSTDHSAAAAPASGALSLIKRAASIALPPSDSLDTSSLLANDEEGVPGLPEMEINGPGDESSPLNTNRLGPANKLHIVRLFGPEAVQNGTQNVTIDCMFKFDRKLDQRLTVKWFFNDEVEPIYQWIPELNKRVYSDKYERFLDKSYQVSEDVDFMLQAYRWLLAGNGPTFSAAAAAAASQEERAELEASRRLLAARLNKLAKLGGQHSRQLLESLRAALFMEQLEWSRFRALRLIRPTTELNGRFTCSVSSLDGDDLRSTRLVVYEPAKNFSFSVARTAIGQQYNLSCQADQTFPRPSLTLIRYRAGPLDPSNNQQQQSLRQLAHRPKLAATLLRQEPIPGSQTQLTVSIAKRQLSAIDLSNNDIAEANLFDELPQDNNNKKNVEIVYGISTWALIDELSLSSNIVTQFECALVIEGTSYEQRQSLALQRGWHVNAAALTSRSTLLGLFGALASLLCLMLALVSSMLIFKLLRRHAKNRVHQKHTATSPDKQTPDLSSSHSTGVCESNRAEAGADEAQMLRSDSSGIKSTNHLMNKTLASVMSTPKAPPFHDLAEAEEQARYSQPQPITNAINSGYQSEAVYRVPENSTFGTRFVIGPRSGQYYNAQARNNQNRLDSLQI